MTPLLIQGSMLSEVPQVATIHEFLFEVTKDGSVFWVGAAVPVGTTDFTRTQVYFHPTVRQGQTTVAADTDYRGFTGGWPVKVTPTGTTGVQRYVAMEGGQLAGARLMPLLVPFTTMGALENAALNMFSTRPIETLNGIMAEIQTRTLPVVLGTPNLTQVGVSSFSSGIKALRLFLSAMSSSGLVKEVIDFDSPFIVAEPKSLTLSSGAVSKCYTQHFLANPPAGWVHLPTTSFAGISSFPELDHPAAEIPVWHAHACIGFMTYFVAMLTSAIH